MAHLLERRVNQSGGIRDWATSAATSLGLRHLLAQWRTEDVTKRTAGGVISVQIVPGFADVKRYRLTVSYRRTQGQPQRLYSDDAPQHSLDGAKATATEQLRLALAQLGGDALVEFIVPIELFDEPFDELVPTKRYTNLGRIHPTVLRDYDRQLDGSLYHNWRRRWERLESSGTAIRWLLCSEDLTAEQFSAELELDDDTTVLALSRRPSSGGDTTALLRVALDSGLPVAMWRRDTCYEHDNGLANDECSGRRFREAITMALREFGMDELPATVRIIRNRAAVKSPSVTDKECRGTVLLWDDPRSVGSVLAVEPPYKPEKSL
jgi:hypothetical protein